MHDLPTALADMRRRVIEMKGMIVTAPSGAAKLRQALYDLEAAVHTLERAAADAYRAT